MLVAYLFKRFRFAIREDRLETPTPQGSILIMSHRKSQVSPNESQETSTLLDKKLHQISKKKKLYSLSQGIIL